MLKALRTSFFGTDQQRALLDAKIDQTLTTIPIKKLQLIPKLMYNRKKCNSSLLQLLSQKIESQNMVEQLKGLIVVHMCYRENIHEQIAEYIIDLPCNVNNFKKSKGTTNINKFEQFYREKVTSFYLVYLKKIAIQKQSYNFIKSAANKKMPDLFKENTIEQVINHGFNVLNISRFMLTGQQMFNKLGRYHPDHLEIISLYLQFLKDMNIFNTFYKLTIDYLVHETYDEERTFQKSKIDKIGLDGRGISNMELSDKEKEQTKHIFLYINEAQQLSDKLFEFYHNFYYFKTLRKMLAFPTFLEIAPKEYAALKNKAKRVDPSLLRMIKLNKQPKYSENQRLHTHIPSKNATFTEFKHVRNNKLETQCSFDVESVSTIDEKKVISSQKDVLYDNINLYFHDESNAFSKKKVITTVQCISDLSNISNLSNITEL